MPLNKETKMIDPLFLNWQGLSDPSEIQKVLKNLKLLLPDENLPHRQYFKVAANFCKDY